MAMKKFFRIFIMATAIIIAVHTAFAAEPTN